jgi:hypothetical protein
MPRGGGVGEWTWPTSGITNSRTVSDSVAIVKKVADGQGRLLLVNGKNAFDRILRTGNYELGNSERGFVE